MNTFVMAPDAAGRVADTDTEPPSGSKSGQCEGPRPFPESVRLNISKAAGDYMCIILATIR
jgi:hypothetical protein